MFVRMREGMRATLDPWLLISRGLHREHRGTDDTLVGQMTDEVTLRGIWSHYKKVMTQRAPRGSRARRAPTRVAARLR
jgi:hypothetical protein